MAAWMHRIARDDAGKFHFVFARYRPEDMRQRCGLIQTSVLGPDGADSVDEMRQLAEELLRACDKPVITMQEYEYEPGDDDDEDDEDEED